MGWTDDPDEEGLIEENPFIFAVIAVILLAVAGILYFVGIDYDPGWFEGLNLVSTMGVIFLIIFIPAIAISTLTGHSDLVKWEALFLFGAVFMILIGNNFDFQGVMESFSSTISSLGNIQVNQLLMALVVIIGVAIAFAVGAGKNVSMGAILIIVILLLALGLINMYNAGTFENWGNYVSEKGWAYAIGKALSDFAGGLADGEAGMMMGFSMIVVGIILVLIPSHSTIIGAFLIIVGCGVVGNALWDEIWQPIINNYGIGGWGLFAGSLVGPGIFLPFIIRYIRR